MQTSCGVYISILKLNCIQNLNMHVKLIYQAKCLTHNSRKYQRDVVTIQLLMYFYTCGLHVFGWLNYVQTINYILRWVFAYS